MTAREETLRAQTQMQAAIEAVQKVKFETIYVLNKFINVEMSAADANIACFVFMLSIYVYVQKLTRGIYICFTFIFIW